MNDEELIKVLRQRRKTLGITQRYLSELSGVGVRTIRQIEENKGNPTIRTLGKIADVLGLQLKLEIRKVT